MFTVNRSVIRALVVRRTRVVDRGNAHPQADLNIDIDDAYREMRDYCTENKWSTYLKTTGSQTLPTTPATNETFVVLPVPTDARTIKRVEIRDNILSTTAEWLPAEEVPLSQLRSEVEGFSRIVHVHRRRWCLIDQGLEATEVANTGTVQTGVIALSPAPTSAGTYQIWYLPEFPGTTADSGANGFYTYANDTQKQLHVYLAAEKILISDNDSNGMLAGIVAKRQAYESKLIQSRPTHSGPRTWRRSRHYSS